jgi:folate-binding protein YgfZ
MTARPSPLLALPGAVPADDPDAAVAAHYGDPTAEQRAASEGTALVDRSQREVLALSGTETVGWLHTITSQYLEGLPVGAGGQALVLDPNGRVEHHLVVAHAAPLPGEEQPTVWLDVEPGTGDALRGYLERMRFWTPVEITDATPTRAVLTLLGPGTPATLAAAGLPVPGPAGPLGKEPVTPALGVATGETFGGVVVRALPHGLGVDLLVPRDRLTDVVAQLRAAGATLAGLWAFEALRITAGLVRLGQETDDRSLPHEAGWVGTAVHLRKGCYRGQETVARVHNLGRPPRRTVLLQLDGSVDRLPARHADVVDAEGRRQGWVGPAVRHADLGPVALAVVRRAVPDGASLLADGIAALVEPLPHEVVVAASAGA